MRKLFFLLSMLFIGIALLTTSCKHHPDLIGEPDPNDTTPDPIDTVVINPIGDGIDTTGWPCDPDSIYFEYDILPILVSNCAMSGCHSVASHKEGVILTSYAYTMNTADVTPYSLNNSDLWEVITDNNPNDVMPPPPATLTTAQKDLIAAWINQGAKNLSCNPSYGVCDTTNVTFSAVVQPIMQTQCVGCHKTGNEGGGINLQTHAGVAAIALNGDLMGSIRHLAGYSAMPKSQAIMPTCQINKIQAWVNAGAPNN